MNHLALYRKYRPKKLAEVVRQEFVVQSLLHQIENDSISHAYLFCGPRGTGKTSVAKIFASAINCEKPISGEACGKCSTCLALAENNLDIVEIDAASNNGVDEIRNLREKAQYPPVVGRYKVYIIDEVHMLSINAFNALLKTLEEPPKHVVFILATTEVFKLPATILSRCMRFDFKLLAQADIEGHLKVICNREKVRYEESAIAIIARAGNGSMRDSLSIADTCFSYCVDNLTYAKVYEVLGSTDFAKILQLLQFIFQEKANKAINLLQEFCEAGKSIGNICKDILDALSAIITAYSTENANVILGFPTEIFEVMQKMTAELDNTKLLRVLEIFTDTEQKLRYALTPKILLETAIFKSAVPASDVDILALTQRLQKLEKEFYLLKQSGGNIQKTTTEKVVFQEKKPPIQKELPVDIDETFNGDIKKYRPPTVTAESKMASPKIESNILGHMMQYFRKYPNYEGLKQQCLNLQEAWQDKKVILQTEDSFVSKALQTQYAQQLKEVLQNLGIVDYVVEYIAKEDDLDREIEKMQKNFKGIKIEIEE